MAGYATKATAPADRLLDRIHREFGAQRAMRLTLPQASRLFAVDPSMCRSLLDQLVDREELVLAPDGAYQRRDLLLPTSAVAASAPAFIRR